MRAEKRASATTRSAHALLSLGLPNDAVSRAYYAAFHDARALLVHDGVQPKTHRGVVALPSQSCGALTIGGEGGIRTLGTLASSHDFQSCTFDHSVTSPMHPGGTEARPGVKHAPRAPASPTHAGGDRGRGRSDAGALLKRAPSAWYGGIGPDIIGHPGGSERRAGSATLPRHE